MDTAIAEGAILAGKYRVDRVLGVGGMGVVVAAHHLELDDRVAIKFLLPETLNNPEAVQRFAREARAAVKIKSEHVARVSDVGKLDNGAPYLVMEYLEGSDLSGWLSEHGPLPCEQAVEFTLQAGEAIAEAHALGIVHRDLKPANLFVIRGPGGGHSIKVLDFGISKMTSLSGSGGDAAMTKTRAMLGSPLYMSPEQIHSSKDVDSRTDIWALGVILYEVLTGEPPFGGEHMAELIYRIVSTPPAAMLARRPEIPAGLEQVILRCLEKNRDQRFASIAELATALLPFAPQRSLLSVQRISGVMAAAFPPRGPAIPPASKGTDEPVAGYGTQASWGATRVEKARSKWLFVGAAAVFVIAAAVVVARMVSGTAAQASASRSSAASPPAFIQPPPSAAAEGIHSAPTPVSAPPQTLPAPSFEHPPAAPASAVAGPSKAVTEVRKVPKPNLNPSKKAPASEDPWGGSQH